MLDTSYQTIITNGAARYRAKDRWSPCLKHSAEISGRTDTSPQFFGQAALSVIVIGAGNPRREHNIKLIIQAFTGGTLIQHQEQIAITRTAGVGMMAAWFRSGS